MAIDEKAHHAFFRDCLKLYIDYDRPAVIEQLRRVMNDFSMPAIGDLLDDSTDARERHPGAGSVSAPTSISATFTCQFSIRSASAGTNCVRRSARRSRCVLPEHPFAA